MFDFLDGFDIEDWMLIGPMAEDLANEEKERRQLDDLDQDDEKPWYSIA